MTLLSMCMNLMQEQILEKVTWVASELGMNGDGNDEEVVKLSIEGKVTETPAGEVISFVYGGVAFCKYHYFIISVCILFPLNLIRKAKLSSK